MKKRKKQKPIWMCVLLGAFAGLVICLVIGPLSALAVHKEWWPREEMGALASVQWMIGAFVGCLTSMLTAGKKKLPVALITVGALCALRILVGLCYKNNRLFSGEGLTAMALLMLGGAGALACLVKIPTKRRH